MNRRTMKKEIRREVWRHLDTYRSSGFHADIMDSVLGRNPSAAHVKRFQRVIRELMHQVGGRR